MQTLFNIRVTRNSIWTIFIRSIRKPFLRFDFQFGKSLVVYQFLSKLLSLYVEGEEVQGRFPRHLRLQDQRSSGTPRFSYEATNYKVSTKNTNTNEKLSRHKTD